MYLRQNWKDQRLEFNPDNLEVAKRGEAPPKEIRLGNSRWNEIWLPDTFFRNEKKAEFHHVTVDNRLLKLNATGYLWYVTK